MKIDTPWLSQYENIKASYDYPDISLVDFLEETVKKYPTHIAYNYFNRQATLKEFFDDMEFKREIELQFVCLILLKLSLSFMPLTR